MALGSVLAEIGDTKVLCTASLEKDVPRWMRGSGEGWVTAEYSLLPGSSSERVRREAEKGRQSGRTMEIQRLIGRSLRAVCDMKLLGERSLVLDCDVLQADGGTRTIAISGAYLALHDACERLAWEKKIRHNPLTAELAAVSVGMLRGTAILDLNYDEDFRAEVDMNVVMNDKGEYLEIQGTAEGEAFSGDQLNQMLGLAGEGAKQIFKAQKALLEEPPKMRR